jgi:hypothetical protein
MRRARQRFVAVAVAFVTWLVASSAFAFHAGNLFDVPPGGGGGGGLFYTGSPREHGWTCGACHIDAPGRSRVNVSSDPPELVAAGSYAPGQTYRLSFALTNEYLGLGSPLSNYNSIAVTALDRSRAPAGAFAGFAAADYYTRGMNIIASAGRTPNETSWSFDWRAPAAGAGRVQLFIAVVDGNAANSTATVTLTDPFGDDIALGSLTLAESASAALPRGAPVTRELGGPRPRATPSAPPVEAPRPRRGRWVLGGAVVALLAGLAVALVRRRGRRARLLATA